METAVTLSRRARRLYGGTKTALVRLQVLRPYICPLEEILPLVPAGSAVLDVGCGGGLFLGLLADSGRVSRAVGFDSSPAAVAVARSMTVNLPNHTTVEIRHIDATAPWPSESYDVVSLVDVLHHVPPAAQRAVLSRAFDCVRPGGLLLYKDMATKPKWRAICNQLHDLVLARQWIHHVPVGLVEMWAAENGMRLVAQGAASRLWYAHEWRVFHRLD